MTAAPGSGRPIVSPGALVMARAAALLIALAAFAVRASPILGVPEAQRNGLGSFGDSFVYHTLAFNLLEGRGYSATAGPDTFGAQPPAPAPIAYVPGIFRPPAYPLFLALIYRLCADPGPFIPAQTWRIVWDRVRLIQALLDATVCLLVFGLARAIIPSSPWPALIAAALYAVCPYPIYYTRALLSESLTTWCVAAFLWCAARAIRRARPQDFLLTGIALGLAALSRPEYALFGGLFGLALVWRGRRALGRALRQLVPFVCGAGLVIAPWTIRNLLVFRRPILISSGGWGGNLYFGAVLTRDTWRWWWSERYPDRLFLDAQERDQFLVFQQRYLRTLIDGTLEEIHARDRAFFGLTLQRLRRQPLTVVKHWLVKIPRLWYVGAIPFYRDREASGWWFLGYLALALWAWWAAGPESRAAMAPVLWLVLYLTAVFIPLHVESRYSVPAMPGLVSLAGLGLGRLVLPRRFARVLPHD